LQKQLIFSGCLVYLLLSSAYSRENFRKNKYFHDNFRKNKYFHNNFRENLQKYYVTRVHSQKWSLFHMLLTSFAFFNKLRKCQHLNIFATITLIFLAKISLTFLQFLNIFASHVCEYEITNPPFPSGSYLYDPEGS
jgi:hypothetical protein